ncbi:MAG: hypothetical protein ACM309_11480 [Bacillota bacterium]
MTGGMDELASEIRKTLEHNEGGAIAGILHDMGVSLDNPDRIKGLLGGLGYGDSQLFDPTQLVKIAESFLASMPEETRRQLLGVVLQVAADMGPGNVPKEILGALSSTSTKDGQDTSPGEHQG